MVYIHIFCILGWLIGLTLFIGVVVANYNENKGENDKEHEKKSWADFERNIEITQNFVKKLSRFKK